MFDQMLDCKQEKVDVQPQASPEGTSPQLLRAVSLLLNINCPPLSYMKQSLSEPVLTPDVTGGGAEFDPPDRSELAGTGENGS